VIKRAFDLTASAIGLLVLAPLFAVIAILIKCDSAGPVFFRQERVGRYGVPFRILKFRTMRIDVEPRRQITVGQDPRITRVGNVLRRYKLDELPQLVNVVRGEMSLVGPRPEVPCYVAVYPEEVRRIVLSVAPGITDWASIYFRDESAILGRARNPEAAYINEVLPVKLAYYVRYARERTFMTDLKIIFLTLAAICGLGRRMSHPER
jgi:lipopolysaccharide/colanic/teichoic acid biosynthesis glycosyltransferase